MFRSLIFAGLFLATCVLAAAQGPVVVRGPYLQLGTSTSIIVRWRTDVPSESEVWLGPAPGQLTVAATDPALTTEHAVTIGGLAMQTSYHYAIGAAGTILAGDDADHHFKTAPPIGSRGRVRAWILGDCGHGNAAARAVRDGYHAFTGSVPTDLWLMLGDNAYSSGTDAEYQTAVFQNKYEATLRTSVLWPTLGNHDALSALSSLQMGVYYDIFDLPASGEAGGLPSGTEAYYSFDWANIHFVCLDSAQTPLSPTGAMATWVAADLAATTQDWVVVFFHHPPYTKGTHDSDTESILVQMRQNFMPIFDAQGVDLVLCGHSHGYERSMLIDGHFGISTTFDPMTMALDTGFGLEGFDGAYVKNGSGTMPHSGVIAVVAGASAAAGAGTYDHPVMLRNAATLGSLVLDVEDQQLDLRYIGQNGETIDAFTIVKSGVRPVRTWTIARAFGDAWRFHDQGVDQGSAWAQPSFDASTWAVGAAPLGFGEIGLATILASGPAGAVYPTTYFRSTFMLDVAPSGVEELSLAVDYDDGYVAYLNGVEVTRSTSMPAGAVTFATLATSHEHGTIEGRTLPGASSLLVAGANVLAVEVHQTSATSSDLYFDAALAYTSREPHLAPCAEGTVMNNNGTVEGVLFVNGSDGGFGRAVRIGINQPIVLDIATPPLHAGAAHHSIFGFIGAPSIGDAFTMPFGLGDLCFPPSLLGPTLAPASFLVADTYGLPGALVAGVPTPQSIVNASGLPFPFQVAFQGWIESAPGQLALTNAILVDIVP